MVDPDTIKSRSLVNIANKDKKKLNFLIQKLKIWAFWAEDSHLK